MTSKEAYLSDLDDLEKEIERLLSLVPVGKTKKRASGARAGRRGSQRGQSHYLLHEKRLHHF